MADQNDITKTRAQAPSGARRRPGTRAGRRTRRPHRTWGRWGRWEAVTRRRRWRRRRRRRLSWPGGGGGGGGGYRGGWGGGGERGGSGGRFGGPGRPTQSRPVCASAQGVRFLRGQSRRRSTIRRWPASQVPLGAGQDRAAPQDRHLCPPPARPQRGSQARSPYGPLALCRPSFSLVRRKR